MIPSHCTCFSKEMYHFSSQNALPMDCVLQPYSKKQPEGARLWVLPEAMGMEPWKAPG